MQIFKFRFLKCVYFFVSLLEKFIKKIFNSFHTQRIYSEFLLANENPEYSVSRSPNSQSEKKITSWSLESQDLARLAMPVQVSPWIS